MTASTLPVVAVGGGALPLVGRTINGKFRVVAPLGEGGMGVVVAAETQAGQRVAIKLLRPEMLDDRDVVRRFLEEASTQSRIQHPNVLRVFDRGTTEEGIPYIVMELLEGTSLGALMQTGGAIPPAAAVPILQGVLAGLGAAHAAGIVHRDLKPENVFLERKNVPGGYEVKLLDFGIARVMDAAGGMGHRTKTGIILGTPAYMSPEQLRSSKDADGRTDLWSAGVLFYEMLCGRHPFPAENEFARLSVILGAPPAPLDDVARPFASILERALAKDRDARFSSAIEMAHALAQAPTSTIRPTAPPASSVGAHSYAPAAFVSTALQPVITPEEVQRISAIPESGSRAGLGGTLSSAARSPGSTLSSGLAPSRNSAPPPVLMAPPREEDPRPRGLAPMLVVAFVGFALVIGFVLGFAVGRLQ